MASDDYWSDLTLEIGGRDLLYVCWLVGMAMSQGMPVDLAWDCSDGHLCAVILDQGDGLIVTLVVPPPVPA